MPVGTDTEAVGDMPNVFTRLQGDFMAGAVCVEGHEAEVRSRWYGALCQVFCRAS